ncbi:MAG: amino acid adenylation domain-containing protein [Gordonia sp. (in: high G+C Gram-positive bacteria)]
MVVQKTPYTFDCSVPELFAPLMVGATVVVLKDGGHLEPRYVAQEIARTGATMVHFVPSMLSVFLDVVPADVLASLDSVRIVSTTGEALPPAVAAPTRAVWPGALFYNLYGPTEAAVEITFEKIGRVAADDPTVPIGVPVWNSSAVVLDARLHRVPAGVAGELYVGGVQLARGYAARPDLTAERFVADPYGGSGARLYRTGDLVRRSASGQLEYLGRTDFQVKLRGQRIELGEIESVIAAAPGVVHTAVTVAASPDGGEHLVVYVSAGPGESIDLDAVKGAAGAALPGYMVPGVWMVLDDIALNTAGKIDRKALPTPEFVSPEAEYVAPDGDAETAVAVVFAELLGVDRVGVTESFFDAGGNSLSAMRLVARAGEVLGVELSVRDLFDAPTVRGLVELSGGRAPALAPIVAADPRPDRVPLSFAQQRMWLINQFDSATSTYNIPVVLQMAGDLNVVALEAALADVAVRHEALRTTFPAVEGVPYQQIAPAEAVAEQLDWQVVASHDELVAGLTTGFDVVSQWPLRVRLLPSGKNQWLLGVVMHHIAADGESMLPFLSDVVTAYAARVAGEVPAFVPLEVQVADFAIWQHAVLGSPGDSNSVVGGQLGFWQKQLAGAPAVLEIPADRPRPSAASGCGARFDFEIPAEVGARVEQVAREHDVTPFMVVHAGLAALLSRLACVDDVSIGTPIAGRGQAVLEPLVGMFVNTLVLRTPVDSAAVFGEFLETVKRVDLDAFAHSDAPFEAIVEAVDPVRSEAFAPLVQVLLSFNPAASLAEADFTVAGLDVAALGAPEVSAKVDLTVTVQSALEGSTWTGAVDYATDMFDRQTVARFTESMVRLLDGATANPDVPVGDISIVDDATVGALVPVKGAIAESAQPLAAVFAAAARREPARIAVRDNQTSLTYSELDARSNQLARWLRSRGVGAGSLVAVGIERSADLLTAVWAIAKAGGAYMPVDPSYPAERVEAMLADSGARVGLAGEGVSELPDGVDWQVVGDDFALQLKVLATGALDDVEAPPASLDDLAYVIYTSGSTGLPKGVAVTHRGLRAFAEAESDAMNCTDGAVVLGFASPSFDASILELLLATVNAGTLVYRPADVVGGDQLAGFIREQRITHVFLTPPVLATLDPTGFADVISVGAGGEALPQALADAWTQSVSLVNMYGPSETTVAVAMTGPLGVGEPVRLGGPTPGAGLMVLDNRLHPVPEGVIGELYATGPALARGYLNRPDLTSERFVADPYSVVGSRMYRTGDVVRWRRDTRGELTLEYSGRADDQVKLRGLRIELGEIESVLGSYPGVEAAVVVGVGGSIASALAGYVVTAGEVDLDRLREHARTRLPSFMVPASIAVLDALPLTPVGKLDKAALPEPELNAAEYVAPTGEVEEKVAAVFAEVLGVEPFGATESFFDAGGNSLSAVRVRARLANRGLDVELAWLFSDPTPRALAQRIAEGGSPDGQVLLPLRTDGSRKPLFTVHPAGGLAWFYGGFVPYLSDRPIYGLQDPHVVAGEDSVTDARELAGRYVDEIRRVQPEGPYHLLGWSVGGVIAHSMATLLREAGQDVAYLGIMDAVVADPESVEAPESAAAAEAAESGRRGDMDSAADVLGGWRELFDIDESITAGDAEEVAAIVRQQIAGMGLLSEDQVERIMESFDSSADVVASFEPQLFDGSLQVFTATADKDDPSGVAASWRPHVAGEILNVDVDTHHLGMANPEALAVIGPEIEAALARLEEP